MLQKYKKIIWVVVIIIVLFFVYTFFFNKEDEQPLTTTNTSGVSLENSEILSLLARLESINLDSQLLSTDLFRSLVDFSVTLIPEPVGRDNPFAPIGAVNRSSNDDLDLDFNENPDGL